jgi:hypothetical protein
VAESGSIHIAPDGESWRLRLGAAPERRFATAAEAVSYARGLAEAAAGFGRKLRIQVRFQPAAGE